MRSSKDFLEDDFQDLNDVEYVENLVLKQVKKLKSSFHQNSQQKKFSVRLKRQEKEYQKESAYNVTPTK